MTDLDAPYYEAFRWRELDEGRYDNLMDPDELDRRMDARRATRTKPLGAGTILVLLAAAALYAYVVWATVWGVMA